MTYPRALSLGLFALVVSCAPFQDSPFSDQLLRPERDLNVTAQARLRDMDDDGVIRIAVFTDSHQNYTDLDKVINEINRQEGIDFVANLGDFTDTAYNIEYNQFLDSYVRILRPTFTAIGNHDAIGAGPNLFRKAFGPANFWFESDAKRFVFFHSANWEDLAGFRPDWLLEAVESSTKPVIIFSHVSLRDEERFLGEEAQTLNSVITHSRVQMIVNGHDHVYHFGTDNGTILLQGARVQGGKWMLLEIQGHQLSVKQMNTGEVVSATLKH